MSNNKQSSVEWLSNQAYELFEQYSEGNFNRIILNKLMVEATKQAKAMHKEEIIKAWVGGKGCLNGEQYYNETFGGNNE